MDKNVQDLIIILKDGRKLPCSMEVNQAPKDFDIELQEWLGDDYDLFDHLDGWYDVKAVRLKDGTVIYCNAIYPLKSEHVEEISSYKDVIDTFAFMGIEDEYFEIIQQEDIDNEEAGLTEKAYTIGDIHQLVNEFFDLVGTDSDSKIAELGLDNYMLGYGEYQAGGIRAEELFSPVFLKSFGNKLTLAIRKLKE